MSGIELHPQDGGGPISVSPEKTTIGRGLFMKITDKRVSRNHAILEVNDEGELVVTPIHTNPCFLHTPGSTEKLTLLKNEGKVLSHGDVLALLPDSLLYKVIYKNKTAQSKVINEETDDDEESEEENKEDTPPKVKVNGKTGGFNKSTNKQTVHVGRNEVALPVDKIRLLPKWMMGAAKRVAIKPARDASKSSTNRPKIAANAQTPKEKTVPLEESEEERPPPKPTPKKGGRGVPKRRVIEEDEDGEEDEEEEEVKPKLRPGRGRRKRYDSEEDEEADAKPKRQRRMSAQRKTSYTDDLDIGDADLNFSGDSSDEQTGSLKKGDDDSDFIADEQESGSDWEVTQSQGSRRGKRKGKGRTAPPTPRSRTRGSRRKSRRKPTNDSDLDLSDENGDAYIPRPSRSRGSPRGSPRGKSKQYDSEEDSEEEAESPPRRRRKVTKPKPQSEEESEEEEEESDTGKRKTKSKPRKSCWFGKKCYRKNPKHFEEFCHPDDESYDEEEVEAAKRGEKKPKRPVRDKDLKSVLRGASDDDGEANTYDYDDSFLAAEDSASATSSPFEEEDSDWEPEQESIGSLVKEAKGFIKNKKLQKPGKKTGSQ